jgi:four helix bundle protein
MSDYHRLDVWRAAHELTLSIYRATSTFPRHEQFGLTSQLRRAGVSVGANIAEGSSRGDKEFCRFLTIALGSTNEVEYLLLVATALGYVDGADLMATAAVVGRKLTRLRRTILKRTAEHLVPST